MALGDSTRRAADGYRLPVGAYTHVQPCVLGMLHADPGICPSVQVASQAPPMDPAAAGCGVQGLGLSARGGNYVDGVSGAAVQSASG